MLGAIRKKRANSDVCDKVQFRLTRFNFLYFLELSNRLSMGELVITLGS